MNQDFQYDVFLSHNQADKPRVRRLAERLRAANWRVWFDEWVIQPGDDIFLAIERGLEASRTLVLCLSPAALGLVRVALEHSTGGRGNLPFRDPANAGRRCIPVRLDEALIKGHWRNSSISIGAWMAGCDGEHLTDFTPLQADKLHDSQ